MLRPGFVSSEVQARVLGALEALLTAEQVGPGLLPTPPLGSPEPQLITSRHATPVSYTRAAPACFRASPGVRGCDPLGRRMATPGVHVAVAAPVDRPSLHVTSCPGPLTAGTPPLCFLTASVLWAPRIDPEDAAACAAAVRPWLGTLRLALPPTRPRRHPTPACPSTATLAVALDQRYEDHTHHHQNQLAPVEPTSGV